MKAVLDVIKSRSTNSTTVLFIQISFVHPKFRGYLEALPIVTRLHSQAIRWTVMAVATLAISSGKPLINRLKITPSVFFVFGC
jgi:hypothetical protein